MNQSISLSLRQAEAHRCIRATETSRDKSYTVIYSGGVFVYFV